MIGTYNLHILAQMKLLKHFLYTLGLAMGTLNIYDLITVKTE